MTATFGSLGASAVALAGTVVYTNTEWNTRDVFTNLVVAAGDLDMVAVDETDATGDFYRFPWEPGFYAIEVEKDNNTFFASDDVCLKDSGNTFSDTDTTVVNGNTYRAGTHAGSGGNGKERAIDTGVALSPPATVDFVEEIRFLTSGARRAAASYTITFDYADATPSVDVIVPIPRDNAAVRTGSSAGAYDVFDWIGTVHDSGNADCVASGANEVWVYNPNPLAPIADITFTYPDNTVAAPGGFLGGPLALTWVIDELGYESTFTYRSTFKSETSTATAILNGGSTAAQWTAVSYTRSGSFNGEVDLYFQCGNDTDADGLLETGELSAEQGPFALSTGTNHALTSCVGRYAVYRLEYYAAFDLTTSPSLADVTFTYVGDGDGDGVIAPADCNDANATIFPGAAEVLADGIDQDCSGGDSCYDDADNDGARSANARVSTDLDCLDANEGVAADPIDCNDTNAAINPSAAEVTADGIDQNCNGGDLCFADADNDNARSSSATTASADLDCADAFEGASTDVIDCNDGSASINPFASEVVGDLIDQDCSGTEVCWADADGDGSRSSSVSIASADLDCADVGEAPATAAVDCNDANNTIEPGATEVIADGVDQDCSGGDTCYDDADNDGARAASATRVSADLDCLDPNEGVTADPIDCNDTSATVNPSAAEITADGIDQDCNGGDICFADADNDNARSATATLLSADLDCLDAFEGATADAIDCNDATAAISPTATEIVDDGIDQNCNGGDVCFADADNDGNRHGSNTTLSADLDCLDANEGVTADPVDCDDGAADRFVGNTEGVDNGKDNDCDTLEACFVDADNDGARLTTSNESSTDVDCLDAFEGATADPIDCNDASSGISPLIAEIVGDLVDQNCNGVEDCFEDKDGDGARSATSVKAGNDMDCTDLNELPATAPVDCNDNSAAIGPGGVEVIDDGVDQDCSGGDLCYDDADNDGARNATVTRVSADLDCVDANEGNAADLVDCNDNNAGIKPGAAEVVDDGVDQDCNSGDTCFVDADDDGARLTTTILSIDLDCLDANEGRSADNIDCDDTNAGRKPGLAEVVDDGIDQDCVSGDACYVDGDNDGARLTTTVVSADNDCLDANEGQAGDAIDCNDANAAIKPNGTEIVADGIDQNCDLGDLCFDDADNDGNRHGTNTRASADLDCLDANEGVTADVVDCDDSDAARFFGNTETVDNGKDNDCDTLESCFVDADNDGARLATVAETSTDLDCLDANEGATADPLDCNDTNAAIKPASLGGAESVGTGVDENCDGLETCFADLDGDGDRNGVSTVVSASDVDCTDPGEGASGDVVDCDDNDADRASSNLEVIGNNKDNDCNLVEICYADLDVDGTRHVSNTVNSTADGDCTDAGEGESTDAVDCDDANGARFPGNTETVGNEVDNDCVGGEVCWDDADNDNARSSVNTRISADVDCVDNNEGRTVDQVDCDDLVSTTNPFSPDICGDGVDNDCDGNGDFGTPGAGGFLDDDGDGISYASEQALGTSDCASDTDGDGADDDTELLAAVATNPADPDSDDDGLLDGEEIGNPAAPTNTDGDTAIDAKDTDDDADSIPTASEIAAAGTFDFDLDGTPNHRDLDSDDDGFTDQDEWNTTADPAHDEDGDGDPDFVDEDSDGDTVLDLDEVDGDTDNDGVPNRIDTDDDGDGLPTALEDVNANGDPASGDDTDGDAVPNYLDADDDGDRVLTSLEGASATGVGHRNTDGADAPDYLDTDDDNDGVLTTLEDPNGVGGPIDDNTDGDALPNYRDTDDDGDGIVTSVEGGTVDTDGDGTKNYLDTDSDGDSYTDAVEGSVSTADADGLADYIDTDSDNDEVPDLFELDVDTDVDTKKNRVDADDDGDGQLTSTEEPESNDGNPRNDDTDNDGLADYLDGDDDGDRVLTLTEGTADVDLDGLPNFLDTDDDGDTVLTTFEDPNNANGPADDDSDGDGLKNYLDSDDDDDGVDTVIENAVQLDFDGDGVANHLDLDSDADGWFDGDEYFADADGNFDNDLLLDFVDSDSDGDGVPDASEQGGVQAIAADHDTDNDGFDDRIDTDDDADGVLTAAENSESADNNPRNDDWDNDGLPDFRDVDDDNDDVPTALENYNGGTPQNDDTDGDAVADYLDLDDDGDQVPTDQEVAGGLPTALDTDGDGLDNYVDADDDGDTLDTRDEQPESNDGNPKNDDTDNDGVADFLDADDDDDGVETLCEVATGVDHTNADADYDTVIDGEEWYNSLDPSLGDDDYEDLVGSEPGICLTVFGGGLSTGFACTDPWDRDHDGVVNALDDDDDGDGIPTALEGVEDVDCGALPIAGSGRDGIPNYLDYDADNDGDLDCIAGGPDQQNDGDGTLDSDGDGIQDYVDCDSSGCAGDSDADGLSNCSPFEAFAQDPDSDDDGVLDGEEVADTDGDGVPDAALDTDRDGVADTLDADDDGDGVATSTEAGYDVCVWTLTYEPSTGAWLHLCDDGTVLVDDPPNTDAETGGAWPLEPDTIPDYLDADDDGDGVDTVDEGAGDADGDAVPNYLDADDLDGPGADADADGLPNADEVAAGTAPYDADSDDDGLSDGEEAGRDSDDDGLIDALDGDDDGDGVDTRAEGNADPDGDGVPSYLDDDSDGDGVADAVEALDADADCDGIVDLQDPRDADGPCAADSGVDTGVGVAAGCEGCASTGVTPAGWWAGLAVVAGLARRRRAR